MNKLRAIVFLGISTLLFFACADKDPVVVKVGKDKIRRSEIELKINNAPYQEYVNTPLGKRQFIDWIVREAVLVESAKKDGMDKEKSYKETLKDFKEQQLRQLEEYKNNLLIELYFRKIQDEISVSNEEIAAYYEAHKAEFDFPVVYTVRHILVLDRGTAEKAYEEIQRGMSFEKVVAQYSQDPSSAQNGGLIGPFRKGELVPGFEKAALSLSPGEISEIIETPYGFHIIYKVSQKTFAPISFADAAPEIRRILEREKFDEWFELKKQELGVKVNYDIPLR
jgi:parvulin-like peptidyl-prolyl isomerase